MEWGAFIPHPRRNVTHVVTPHFHPSAVLILTALGLILLVITSADFVRRQRTMTILAALLEELTVAEAEGIALAAYLKSPLHATLLHVPSSADKSGFDSMWANHVASAPEGGEARLYEVLAKLDHMCRDADGKLKNIQQPKRLSDASTLVAVSKAHNDMIHERVRELVQKCGGRYDAGPVKLARRIQAKADGDYEGKQERPVGGNDVLPTKYCISVHFPGNVTKVIDTVRGSGMFNNIAGFTRAIEILIEGGDDVPEILRFKDRISSPLPNGYRDTLMNFTVHGTDGLVCELQLHFEDIHSMSELRNLPRNACAAGHNSVSSYSPTTSPWKPRRERNAPCVQAAARGRLG